MGDDGGQDQADRGADGEAGKQLDQGVAEMGCDQRELGEQGCHDRARRRQDVVGHLEQAKRGFDAADDQNGDRDDDGDFEARGIAGPGREGGKIGEADLATLAATR